MANHRVSKFFYLGSIFGVPILGILLVSGLMALIDPSLMSREDPPLAWVLPAAVFILYGAVLYLVLLYKAWAAIQDGQVRTTPGKAVGFCFIPFFNLYWIFQAFYGFAVDFNRYAARHSLPTRMPEGQFLAYTVLLLASALPLIGILAILPLYVFLAIVILKMCDAINAVADGVVSV